MSPLFDVVYEGTWFRVNRLPRQAKRKTDTYEVLTNDSLVIGHIAWYGPWRKYAYFPEPETVMETQCMQEIAFFLRQRMREHATRKTQAGETVALLFTLFLLLPTLALAQAPASCTHYASPTGTGATCTQAQPCKVQSFWPLAGPGKTLCLKSGTYTGASSMIAPPRGLKGYAGRPHHRTREHDGGVLIDAQHQGNAVWLGWHDGVGPNDWFVIEGINAKNGGDAIFKVSSSNAVVRR